MKNANITDYGGVFLNQPYTGNNPIFYSVRAVDGQQVTVNGKSTTWDWESWSYNSNEIELQSPNSRTTAVVFKQDGATLRANYKGRATSHTRQATVGNNSHHLVYTFLAYPHITVPFIVYSDRGNVL